MKRVRISRPWMWGCALGTLAALLVGLFAAPSAQARVRMGRGEELLWRLPLEERLRRPLSVHLEHVTLEDFVDFLRDALDLNIVIAPEVLRHEHDLITLRLDNLDGERILNWAMTQTGLTYIFHQGAVYITTPDHARQVETRYFKIYDVRDLAASPIAARAGGQRQGEGDVTRVQAYGRDDDDDRRRRGGQDIVSLIVMLTGPENWRQAIVLGGERDDNDGWGRGADDF